jgi:hypothetical protein
MVPISEIAHLQRLSDDDLMLILSDAALPRVIGAAEPTADEKIRRGKSFFADQRPELRDKLCKSSFASQFQGDSYDRIELYAAVIDSISGMFTGVAVAVVAVLIVREGLKSLCAG